MTVRLDGVLDVDDSAIAHHPDKEMGEPVDDTRMPRIDGSHLVDLAVDQFHSTLGMEDFSSAHAVVLVHGEAVALSRHGHPHSLPLRISRHAREAVNGAK